LEDIARGDVLLGREHGLAESGSIEARRSRGPAWRLLGHGDPAAPGFMGQQLGNARELALGRGHAHLAFDLVGDRQHPLIGMIEDDQGVEAPEQRDRQPERIGRAVRQPLDHADEVVAEVAYEAARERDRAGLAMDAVDDLAQGVERRAGQAARSSPMLAPTIAAALDLQAVGVETVDLARPGAEEAEA
jgi:hypothetical protein